MYLLEANKGTVITVSGNIGPSSLGITLSHEHLLCDGTSWWKEPEENDLFRKKIAQLPVSMDLLWAIRRAPTRSVKSNLILDDTELAVTEISEFALRGGSTVVDASSIGLRANPSELKKIADRTGLNIIMGSGFYVQASHPSFISKKTIEEIENIMIREVSEGVDGSKIRPGLIGEIGLSPKVFPSEEKVLIAACRAQRATGLAVTIHCWFSKENVSKIKEILDREGSDRSRFIISHCDATADGSLDTVLQKEVAKLGMYVEYDLFGSEDFRLAGESMVQLPHDSTRIMGLKELVQAGHIQNILVSQDVCRKYHLKKYGGWGYSHILETIVPALRAKGFTKEIIEKVLIDNPTRVLTVS